MIRHSIAIKDAVLSYKTFYLAQRNKGDAHLWDAGGVIAINQSAYPNIVGLMLYRIVI